MPIELRVEARQRLERRRQPGDERERAGVVVDRLARIAQLDLEQLGDAHVRVRGALGNVGRVRLVRMHVDERRPLLACREQSSERLQHRQRQWIERERLLVALHGLLGIDERTLEHLAELVQQRHALALVGRELDE
jgi:hypothetical protein